MTRTLLTNAMAIALVLFGYVAGARGTILSYQANLDGLQEVPPNGSPAFGLLDATVNNVSGAFVVTMGTFQDLLGGSTAVTLNDAAAGTNGPIVFSLTLDTPGAATGTFSGGGTLTAPQIADVAAEKLYVNIRSQVFPSGEIRGQLFALPVPEPGSMVMAVLASFGLAGLRLRRAMQ
jgi:hypothetical protein